MCLFNAWLPAGVCRVRVYRSQGLEFWGVGLKVQGPKYVGLKVKKVWDLEPWRNITGLLFDRPCVQETSFDWLDLF